MSTVSMPLRMEAHIQAPLDPDFRPAALFNENYRHLVELSHASVPLTVALERESGLISRYDTRVLPDGADDEATLIYAERLLKFLLWARGGWKVYFGGPKKLGERLKKLYSSDGARAFDVRLMERVYEEPFTFTTLSPEEVPSQRERSVALGGHLDGCRIGFDLGASDHKIAAVIDGNPVFSDEIPWNPRVETDIDFHYQLINDALKKAASHLPRVDAIGGSSAGIYIDNKVMVASLFRSIPENQFDDKVKPLFMWLREEWGVPLEVINDGDVTALAGAMSLDTNGMLGIAMGSSEAVGFLDGDGRITGWLNELAFAPVDFNPQAATDEWSGDTGVGSMYFSQQAVNKLAPKARITFPKDMGLPDRLKVVQEMVGKGDQGAIHIMETIGVYLGYTIPYYAEYYDYHDLLILGRVTSGDGGDIILDKAMEVLQVEFPDLAEQISLHVPDEKSRRVGQAVAAASLPAL